MKCDDIKGKLKEKRSLEEMLPFKSTVGLSDEEIARIATLTDLLISERSSYSSAPSYSHRVCHLFEQYCEEERHCGKESRGRSYLSDSLLSIAEKLVDTTIKSAMDGFDLSCVDRIIVPIMQYDLDRMSEHPDGFAFKPAILSDPRFIEAWSWQEEYVRDRDCLRGYIFEFCKAGSISDFFAEYVKGLKQASGVASAKDSGSETLEGVFVDVDGTLLRESWDHKEGDSELFDPAHKYILKKLAEGVPVTVFTGGDPVEAAARLKRRGADMRLLDVKSKSEYIDCTLETLIDDTEPLTQGFRSKVYYRSGKDAMKREYPV